jgi:hypothetical protein
MNDTEPDVDRLWSAMLAGADEPPLPTATAIVAAGRRRSRLKTGATAGATAAVALGVAGAAVLAGAPAAGPAQSPAAPALSAASTATAPTSAPPPARPAAPTWQAAHAHGARSGKVLLAAVPAGLTGTLQDLSTDDSPAATWQVRGGPEYISTVYVVVTTGTADGMLSVLTFGGRPDPGTDPCAAALSTVVSMPNCTTTTVGGVPIGVSSTTEPGRGQVNTAVRLLDGGVLVVQAQQGIPRHKADNGSELPPDAVASTAEHGILGGRPPLPAPPLSTTELATLAANPALLP